MKYIKILVIIGTCMMVSGCNVKGNPVDKAEPNVNLVVQENKNLSSQVEQLQHENAKLAVQVEMLLQENEIYDG